MVTISSEILRRTKILVTLGPASTGQSTIESLIKTGVDGFRFNFSHGTIEDFRPVLRTVRDVSSELDRHIACMADLQGPKIRVGKLEEEPLTLSENSRVILHSGEQDFFDPPEDLPELPITHRNLVDDFTVGTKVHVNEGRITLRITEKREQCLIATVLEAGRVWNDKGVNVPDAEFDVPAMTPKDKEDLNAIVTEDFDMVALSFVRQASDLQEARAKLEEADPPIDLLAKIESKKALSNLDEIIDSVEGIIVARGDLGVEIGPERVPYHQKRMIEKANRKGRIVITATQMLESMISNPVPTRAEVSDVANAVLDVSDGVMLSGETAVGDHPVKVTDYMNDIVRATEDDFREKLASLSPDLDELDTKVGATMSNAAAQVANDVDASAIVAPTSTGFTVRMVSKTYPVCPIIALSFRATTRQKVSMYRNVKPYKLEKISSTEKLIEESIRIVDELELAQPGDNIVLLAGLPIDRGGITNLLHVIEIPESDQGSK
ncbi:MAG: pyruvate kinase [bacterium]